MKNLEFDPAAFDDLAWWVEHDRKQALKIIKLIREVQRIPFQGIGKPEKLKHDLSGCWSRRIDREHRLVYQVLEDKEDKVENSLAPSLSPVSSPSPLSRPTRNL